MMIKYMHKLKRATGQKKKKYGTSLLQTSPGDFSKTRLTGLMYKTQCHRYFYHMNIGKNCIKISNAYKGVQ